MILNTTVYPANLNFQQLYRTYILWGRSWLICVLPILLFGLDICECGHYSFLLCMVLIIGSQSDVCLVHLVH